MATARELLRAAMLRGEFMADQYVANAVAADRSWRAIRAAVILLDRGNIGAARRVLQKALDREDRRGARR